MAQPSVKQNIVAGCWVVGQVGLPYSIMANNVIIAHIIRLFKTKVSSNTMY